MIFGIGTDIVEISRISKAIESSERFASRILTSFEMAEYSQSKDKARYVAKKFAAKEALVKAMGTGIGNGISWQMAQIVHDANGRPLIVVFDAIEAFFKQHKVNAWHISISDEVAYAAATVILEKR
jgi:holo-[acyl-carrier protein] synthase